MQSLSSLFAVLSAFGLGAFLMAVVTLILTRADDRRPDLKTNRTEEELARYQAPYTLAGFRRGALLIGFGVTAGIFVLSHNIVFTVPPLVVTLLLPFLYPWWIKRSYFRRFEEGFSECLDIWTRCLQAGMSLQQAIAVSSKDLTGPAANEMGILHKEIGLGDVDGAMRHLYDRMPTDDVRYAALGIITCRQTGGRISEVVANIAEAIRERAAQRERINAITSMGRTEAYIMAVIPAAIGGMMYWLDPETTGLLFSTTVGVIGTLAAIGWECIGLLIIWKIVNVEA